MSLVVLRVADLDASRRFYEGLGLTLRSERHGDGPRHLSAGLGGVVLELYPLASGAPTTGLRLGLSVPAPTAEAAASSAAAFRTFTRAGHQVVVLHDPDGHTIELTTPP